MAISVDDYRLEHVAAVSAFNARLHEGGAPPEFVFPESPVPRWLPRLAGRRVYNEFHLALEDAQVRGTFVLKRQDFSFRGEIRSVGYYHHPFSEGIVNKAYTPVGLLTLRAAFRMEPCLYMLGMGGYARPLPRMLLAMKWNHYLVPFRFRVVHASRFLKELKVLHRQPARSALARLAADTRAGALAIHLRQKWRTSGRQGVQWEPVATFGSWADELWKRSQGSYSMIAVRDRETLEILYPVDHPDFLRIRVHRDGETLGWAVITDVQKQADPEYGNLRLGWIVDVLGQPEHAQAILRAAAEALQSRGVDLILSNQCHHAWVDALDHNGFLAGPSNFIFAASPRLAEVLGDPFSETVRAAHLNRSDGDGLYRYAK